MMLLIVCLQSWKEASMLHWGNRGKPLIYKTVIGNRVLQVKQNGLSGFLQEEVGSRSLNLRSVRLFRLTLLITNLPFER